MSDAVTGLNAAVPFARHVGVTILRADSSGAEALLPEDARLTNHVGSQHAGALYTAAEAASGAAMIGALGDLLGKATPLVREAGIAYRKVARGPITAKAALVQPVHSVRDAFATDGKADFDVAVSLCDAKAVEVATLKVQWSLRAQR